MPALPSKQARRKSATPVTKPEQGDVWRRVLDVMGLEPLMESQNQQHPPPLSPASTDIEAAEAMAAPPLAEAAEAAAAPEAKTKVTILDLPSETQKDIFKHVRIPLPAQAQLCCAAPNPASSVLICPSTAGLVHRPHSPLPRLETLQRYRRRAIVPKLPYRLPRRR